MFIRRRTFGTGAVTWVLFVCFLPPGAIQAQGFLKTSGERIVNEKGENVLLRGVGLGG